MAYTPNSNSIRSSAPTPFVGVCGARQAADYDRLLTPARQLLPDTNAFVMAGIKDFDGDLHLTTPSDLVRPFIHCDYIADEPYTQTVIRRLAHTASFAKGLQLNVVPWMDTDYAPVLRDIRQRYPDLSLMLQAHRTIMERFDPIAIAERISQLPVDYILFDASQSRGVPYDPATMQSYVAAVRKKTPGVGVVVSGGLGPDTMSELFAPLAREFPGISCDAFLKLYDTSANCLAWPAVEQYMRTWRQAVLAPTE